MARTKKTKLTQMLVTWRNLSTVRQFALALIFLIGAALILSLLRTGFYGVVGNLADQGNAFAVHDSMERMGMDGYTTNKSYMPMEDAVDMDYSMQSRESGMPVPQYGGGVGVYDETEFETQQYSATIRTQRFDATCDALEQWKTLEYVVFEHATRNDTYCSYRFKAAPQYVADILQALNSLDPKELTAETESIKRQLVQYDGELAILLQQQDILSKALAETDNAYRALTSIATDAGDAEALAIALNDKLLHVNRLNQQRIQLARQLQSLESRMADARDRIDFAHFSVRIDKYELVSGDRIKESWEDAVRAFGYDVNKKMQELTLGIIFGLLVLAQIVIYFLILLVLAKYGWGAVRRFWKS